MPKSNKYQVFVSSTFTDLHAERNAVIWSVLKHNHIPAGMEGFPAADDRGWRIISSVIEQTDYYVLLVAGRYGAVDPKTGMSWTEREYEHARSLRIPVLAFIREDSAVTSDKMEKDNATRERLDAFKKKIRDNHLCKSWKQSDDLAAAVGEALTLQIVDDEADVPRPGWLRADRSSADVASELARLSRENRQLRERLGELDAPRPTLALDEVADGKRTVPAVKIVGDDGYFRSQAHDDYIDACNTGLWMRWTIRNDGTVAAKDLKVTTRIEPATDADFYGPSIHSRMYVPDPWQANPGRHGYIERYYPKDGGIEVIERIKHINPGAHERTVRMWIALDPRVVPSAVRARVQITDSSGPCLDSWIDISIDRQAKHVASDEELDAVKL